MSLDIRFSAVVETQVYEGNLSHSLAVMADEAGLYNAIWKPENVWGNNTRPEELVPALERGLQILEIHPDHYRRFQTENGAKYEDLVAFVKKYLEACRAYPNAKITISR